MATAIDLEDADLWRGGSMARAPLVVQAHFPAPETMVGPGIIPFGGHSASRHEGGLVGNFHGAISPVEVGVWSPVLESPKSKESSWSIQSISNSRSLLMAEAN
jgi:hypothetical protein